MVASNSQKVGVQNVVDSSSEVHDSEGQIWISREAGAVKYVYFKRDIKHNELCRTIHDTECVRFDSGGDEEQDCIMRPSAARFSDDIYTHERRYDLVSRGKREGGEEGSRSIIVDATREPFFETGTDTSVPSSGYQYI